MGKNFVCNICKYSKFCPKAYTQDALRCVDYEDDNFWEEDIEEDGNIDIESED